MKHSFILFFILFLGINMQAQIAFEKGYILNPKDKKISCFIKYMDWRNNPTTIIYKLDKNGEEQEGNLNNINGFGLDDGPHYLKKTIKMDRSSHLINRMDYDRNPQFKEETLFLRLVEEGTANLYAYREWNLDRFFYSNQLEEPQQLIYKRYRIDNNQYSENNDFKNQLWKNLRCVNTNKKEIENLSYTEKDLRAYFITYNKCSDPNYTPTQEYKTKSNIYRLTVRPKVYLSSLEINRNIQFNSSAENNVTSPALGIMLEAILPFNKNKWSIYTEPTYQQMDVDGEIQSSQPVSAGKTKLEYSSIELPLGVRHYMFLNQKSNLFLSAAFVVDLNLNQKLTMLNKDYNLINELEGESGNRFSVGVGYKYNNRFSVEAQYHTPKKLFKDYVYWNSKYSSFSLSLGYSIF